MWEPIAEGALAERVWRAIEDIAEALAPVTAPAGDLAVFWGYLSSVREDDAETDDRSTAALDQFAVELGNGYRTPALFEGLAGAGWIAAHIGEGVDELLDIVDHRLVTLLERGSWRGDLDLISGIAGIALYLVDRESDDAERGVELAVDLLAARAVRDDAGARWHTPNALLGAPSRPYFPDGAYDCGVAHGAAGIAGVLARIAEADGPALASELAADATRWLLAQRLDGRFPGMLMDRPTEPAREAWCYGSPGTALALGRPDLAVWHGLSPEQTGCIGPALCHGAATFVHAGNRMYHATGEARDRDAALAWLERLLAFHDPARPFAGLTDEHVTDIRQAGILSGAAGIGLVLLATVSDLEPAWDRMLLCDLPVR